MAQVKKLANGGKPKNLEEYEREKRRIEEENAKKQQEADLNSILINGKKYSLSEAKDKLGTWRGSQEAMDLRTSYGRRGRNVDSAYKRFLDIIDSGKIASINFNSDNGFDIQYRKDITNPEDLDLSDKYASDYVASAIRSNLLNLSQNNPQLAEISRIDLNYNPQDMLTQEIWGGEINPSTYGGMTEAQRTADVIRTLKANRDRYNEYFTNPDAFNLEGELPFKSMQEYDQFIANLESLNPNAKEGGSNWDENEILNDRRMGGFWKDYIFGAQQNPPIIETKRKEGDDTPTPDSEAVQRTKTDLGITDATNTTNTTNIGIKIGIDGTLLDANNKPYTGYYDGRPYGANSGWIVDGKWQGDTQTALDYVSKLDVNDPVRQAFNTERQGYRDRFAQLQAGSVRYDTDASKYNILGQLNFNFPELNLQAGGDYIIENYSDRIPESTIVDGQNYSPENWSIINLYHNTFDDSVSPIQNPLGSFMINNKTGEIRRVGIGWNTDTGEAYLTNSEGERLYGYRAMYPQAQSYAGSKLDTSRLNELVQNAYDAVFKNWSDRIEEIAGELPFFSNNEKVITELKTMGYTDAQIDYILKYIKSQNFWTSVKNTIFNPFKSQAPLVRLQVGGKIIGSNAAQTKVEASASDIFDWESMNTADKLKLASMATDLVGLVASLVPVYGNAAGAITGLGATVMDSIARAKDSDGWTWKDTGDTAINLGLDIATVIPGLGTAAKAGKLGKIIKGGSKVITPLIKGLQLWGFGAAADIAKKWLIDGEEPTADDARILINGLSGLSTTIRRGIGTSWYTTKTSTETVNPYYVNTASKSDIAVKGLTAEDVQRYNKLSTAEKRNFIREKLKQDEDFRQHVANKSGKNPSSENADEVAAFNAALDSELETLRLPSRFNISNTWRSLRNNRKMRTSTIKQRELTPKALETYRTGNWYQKALIDEARANGKIINPTVTRSIDQDAIPLLSRQEGDNWFGVIPTRVSEGTNIFGKPNSFTSSREEIKLDLNNPVHKKIIQEWKDLEQDDIDRRTSVRNSESATNQLNSLVEALTKRAKLIQSRKRAEAIARGKRERSEKRQDILNQMLPGLREAEEKRKIRNANRRAKEKQKKETENLRKQQEEISRRIADYYKEGGVLKLQGGGYSYKPSNIPRHPIYGKSITDSINPPGTFIPTTPMTSQPSISTPIPIPTIISDLATTTYDSESVYNLPKRNTKFSLPLTTLTSITSLISKNKANNDIFNILNKGLKPTILDLPKQINYNIQGNEGVRSAYYNQAADLMNLGSKPLTSDADRQLAYNLELAKNAGNLRIQGDLNNEQALQQSREKAFQVNLQNQRDRERVNYENQSQINKIRNAKVQLNAQRRAQRAQNFDTFLHDVTEQIKQRAGEKQQINSHLGLLDLRSKNYEQSVNDSVLRRSIESELMQPNLTSERREELQKSLQEIAKRQFLQALKEQQYQLNSTLRSVY